MPTTPSTPLKLDHPRLRTSFRNALTGVYRLLRDEQNARIHAGVTLVVFIAAVWFDINRIEAAILFIAVILVFGLEIINTAVEDMLDHLHPQSHLRIARIKDGVSGAVLIAATIATVVAFLIFLPYLMDWAKALTG